MQSRFVMGAVVAIATALPAQTQASLTTTYQSDNWGSIGGGVYYDLQVNVPVTIDRIECNYLGAGTAGTVDFWTIPGGHTATNITATAGWTLRGSAIVTSAGTGLPTNCVFTGTGGSPAPFTLMPGLYGVGICGNGLQSNYTNGTGTNQVYSNSELTLTAGSAQNTCFSPTVVFNPRVWNGTIYYTVPAGYARWDVFGAGCPDSSAAFYEIFGGGVSFDLGGSAGAENVIQFIPIPSGYVVTPGAAAWFAPGSGGTPPSGSPSQLLVLADDANSPPLTLPFTISYPGGSTNQIIVGSNGYIYLNMGNSPGAFYWPNAGVPAFVNDGPRHAPFWGDLDPSAGGSVSYDWDSATNTVYVTWDAVPEWSAAGTFSTFQICIDANGLIEYRYRDCAIAVATTLSGWSPGGGVRDPGPIDVSVAVQAGFITGTDASPITLLPSGRPVTGQSVGLSLAGIPTNTALGILFLSAGRTPAPGVSLNNAFGGMEGCFQHVTPPLVTVGVLIAPVSTGSFNVNIPANPSLGGISIFGQAAAAIIPPAFTSSGLISSNGVQLAIDNM